MQSKDEQYAVRNQRSYAEDPSGHAKFGLKSTLYLAYRDSKKLLEKHLFERSAKTTYRILDYGCGAGLSTFIYEQILKEAGYAVEVVGLDISPDNLVNARARVPSGTFIQIDPNEPIESFGIFDLIVCNFVLLELSHDNMLKAVKKLQPLLDESGVFITTNATRQAYKTSNRWYSLKNNFDENTPHEPKGDVLRLSEDQSASLSVVDPQSGEQLFRFFDFFHSGKAYRNAYTEAGLELIQTHKPIGNDADEIPWISEREHSPYKIHVLYVRKNPAPEDLPASAMQ